MVDGKVNDAALHVHAAGSFALAIRYPLSTDCFGRRARFLPTVAFSLSVQLAVRRGFNGLAHLVV